ncbi:unnamed protein product [Albugo candida]|uniref:Uncharacterized protein n=1 Tax=Albugo candida TaxID=65357 RepID=A0A024FU61_9STRA|nr:unnamed protein product [Albugo candida]|eukprot:CCI10556.1 unnamed protein product [Albugo candida]
MNNENEWLVLRKKNRCQAVSKRYNKKNDAYENLKRKTGRDTDLGSPAAVDPRGDMYLSPSKSESEFIIVREAMKENEKEALSFSEDARNTCSSRAWTFHLKNTLNCSSLSTSDR